MSLVQIITEGRKEDFVNKFSNKFSEDQLRSIIDKSDVLPGQHKYLNFLGKVINPKNFNSDLSITIKLLEKFQTVGSNLEIKDINKYDKINTLKKTLDDYDNRIRREIKTIDDADVVYEDDEITVVSPQTHKSSCYFGAGTKWCTTSLDSGHFDRYNQDGKLFYFISKNKPTSDPTYKVALLKKFDGSETYYNAPDDSFRTGWIFGSEKLEKILSRINSYINTTFADQVKIWNDIELAKQERQRLNAEANEEYRRQKLLQAEERRQTKSWDLSNTDSEGEKANALFNHLVSIGELEELTPEIIIRAAEVERLIDQYQQQYPSDDDDDMAAEIMELETELDEYKELSDVYVILPMDSTHYGLSQFEVINDGTTWAVGEDDEMNQASKSGVESLINDIGIEGFNQNFVENFTNDADIESYIRDFFNEVIYESPESYLDDDSKELSNSQKQEIQDLKQEEIDLETERNDLNTDDFEEEYIEERTIEIENRLLEIPDEMDAILEDPDGDYEEESIEKAIEDRTNEYTNDPQSFVSEYIGTDYFEWLKDNYLIDERALIEGVIENDGYGYCLNSYDGAVNEEVINKRLYLMIRVD